MCRIYLLLLLASGSAAGVEPLFTAITNNAATVDGGLSRGVAFGDANSHRYEDNVRYRNESDDTWQ